MIVMENFTIKVVYFVRKARDMKNSSFRKTIV